MGDLTPEAQPQSLDTRPTNPTNDKQQNQSYKTIGTDAPFQSQLSSIPQPPGRSPVHLTNLHYHAQDQGASSLNMGSMAGALPDYSSSIEHIQGGAHMHPQSQRPLSGASTSALVYHIQQNMQIPNHATGSMPSHPSYGHGYDPRQYQHGYMPAQAAQHGNYNPYAGNQQRLIMPNSMQAQYSNMPQAPYIFYPPPYGSQGQFPQGYMAPGAQNQMIYGRQPDRNQTPMHLGGPNVDMGQHDDGLAAGSRMAHGGIHMDPGSMGMSSFGTPVTNRSGPVSSIPRGPPRKPKQSGHALWVGNLPPGTTVVALKDHFSREATKDIESLFLISKSNCAFVNYRTETSCTAAMHRFHDSRFNGVRLVCRLRRSSTPASGVPTGPAAMTSSHLSSPNQPTSPRATESQKVQVDGVDGVHEVDSAEGVDRAEEIDKVDGVDGADSDSRVPDGAKQKSSATEKYFIVKSLTLQDLELSVRNGIWATQSHNEETLNEAYQSADNVYLIFSANKSGEYFGYARMASPILEDGKHMVGPAPAPEILDNTDVPKSIPTPATEFAPKGRIIDDSARGTIFWEADLTDSESEDVDSHVEMGLSSDVDGPVVAQSWGKPFRIEWVSTNRLPFYRTRGLRNPWNQNREVKIARDGTELETSVGERLVQMFHRLGPSANAGGGMQGPLPSLPPPQMEGMHGQMRPY